MATAPPVTPRSWRVPATASAGATVSPAPPNQGGGGCHGCGAQGLDGLFPQTFIDDLKLHANIVQVVQEYVSLKRAGRVYKGLCPFHSEKSPSSRWTRRRVLLLLRVSAGGDVFKFVELQERVGFADAVRLLAQKSGLSLPEPTEGDPSARQDSALREALLKMHGGGRRLLPGSSCGPRGGTARQQLRDRGMTPQTIEQLGLGFAPQSREDLKGRLLKQGFSQGLLVQSGLVVQRKPGNSWTGSGTG